MLTRLKALHERQGWLSGILIDETDDMPSSAVYAYRFGGLTQAYKLIGYDPGRDLTLIEDNRHIRQMHPEIIADVLNQIGQLGGKVRVDELTDFLIVNEEIKASLVISRCGLSASGKNRWQIRFDAGLMPDITIVVLMAANNRDVFDYYLIPAIDIETPKIRLSDNSHLALDAFRFDDLESVFLMAERADLPVAA